ncbi:MAG: GNAT family N-acetyltransferase [Gemmataceae bacterium]|nr:GNAT family N-acetyltransferase [Gemmataceae bacterium]
MADAIIEIIGQDDLPTIVELHNQVFRPAQDAGRFRRRCAGRYNLLQMLARMGDRPVGFFLGAEVDPLTFAGFTWGVHPDVRRQGIATQLIEAVHEWARSHHYETVRLDCPNAARPMMQLALELGYDITGLHCDSSGESRVTFEFDLLRDAE